MKKWICTECGWKYDPAKGFPEAGIPPGVPFEEVKKDMICPLCLLGKEYFVPYEPKKNRY